MKSPGICRWPLYTAYVDGLEYREVGESSECFSDGLSVNLPTWGWERIKGSRSRIW